MGAATSAQLRCNHANLLLTFHKWVPVQDVSSVQERVAHVVESVIGHPISASQPLMEAGLDSLGGVELRNSLSSAFGMELPATLTLDYPSIAAMSEYLSSISRPILAAEDMDIIDASDVSDSLSQSIQASDAGLLVRSEYMLSIVSNV